MHSRKFVRFILVRRQIAVRFQLEWLDDLFIELATLAFFILTGYKFRPASNNPYLQLSQSDDEEEMDEVLVFLKHFRICCQLELSRSRRAFPMIWASEI